MNIKVLNRKQLSNVSKYNYCPFCVKKCTQQGKDFMNEIKPLWHVTTAEQIANDDGTFKDYIDEHYECTSCHNNNITVNDFVKMYCARSDGTKYTEIPKNKLYWNKDKNDFIEMYWDVSAKCWKEVEK